ncbi:MAG: BON domain-containing protein [Gammaproteobacteria bacterium]|nr:BON domain-containing protein [Gammaproteobacteria bacterium]
MNFTRFTLVSALAASTTLLAGCPAVIVGGAAAGGLTAHDRRPYEVQLDDENIEQKANARIGNHPSLDAECHVSITSYNHLVLLAGQCPTEVLRKQAQQVINEVPTVRRVQNEIRLLGPRSTLTASADGWITSKVKSFMVAEKGFDSTRVKVVTENGEVFLMGLVTKPESQRAIAIARNVSGVQRVVPVFEYVEG